MTRYRHPRGASVAIDLGSERVVCDDDGIFETDDEGAVRALAAANDTTIADLRVADELDETAADGDENETCDVVKTDGEVCGRPTPCRYHD
jgi:hypothetical protein